MRRGRRARYFTYLARCDPMSATQDMSFGAKLPNVAVYVAFGAWVAQGSHSSLRCERVGVKTATF